MIIEKQCFSATLAFVITGTYADGVDVALVSLGLQMLGWIAVYFTGRGLQNARAHALGQAENVNGTVHASLGGLHGVVLVMDGRGGASEIVDFIHLNINRKGHIVPLQFEMRMIQ